MQKLSSMRERLRTHARCHKNLFEQAKPFPHVVIDNFFEEVDALKLADDLNTDNIKTKSGWSFFEHSNTSRWRLEDDVLMPPSIKELAWFVNSKYFLLFIEELTGLNSLIGDPYFLGGGAMASQRGGFLNMHIDFNWHHKLQLWRHLNFIVYLTPNWSEEWKGELILSSSNGSEKIAIEPVFNRAVLFSVDDTCYHGQPDPLECPSGIFRTLFSSFYYCTTKPSNTSKDPHFTKYSLENSKFARALGL